MKSFSYKKILILVTILAVPGFLYYLLQEKGKNRYTNLPYFGPKELTGSFHTVRGKQIPDTLYHTVGEMKFINQKGAVVHLDSIKDNLLILNLFFTKGGYGVESANRTISKLSTVYVKNAHIQFLSINIDPTNDSLSVIKEFAKNLPATAGKWDFLVAPEEVLFPFIKNKLLLDVVHEDGKISYSNMFILLDYKHRIRGFYEATNKDAVLKLDDEIKVLMSEELRNNRDGR